MPTVSEAVAVPKKSKKTKKKSRSRSRRSRKNFELSGPSNFRQPFHVDFDSETGFKGLPSDWDVLLKSSDISKKECIENSAAVISALEFFDSNIKKPEVKKIKMESSEEEDEKEEQSKDIDFKLRPNKGDTVALKEIANSDWIDSGDPTSKFTIHEKIAEGFDISFFFIVSNRFLMFFSVLVLEGKFLEQLVMKQKKMYEIIIIY